MQFIRPRLIDHYGISAVQAHLDFAIPFLDEDIPLYVDPFLLWKSPSFQDKSLHGAIVNCFNHIGYLSKQGQSGDAVNQLIIASECDEVGLGVSAKRKGVRISKRKAEQILRLFDTIATYDKRGFTHFEEIQLFVDGISKDRISDFACSFMKSFLIDFTIDQCEQVGLPITDCVIPYVYDLRGYRFVKGHKAKLPINPADGKPILFVPKRWLRFTPWLNFDEYFRSYCPLDDLVNPGAAADRVRVLNYNRDNYGTVEAYVREKERSAQDCVNDPLFAQIPVLSARRKLASIRKIPPGREDGADRRYERIMSELLASLLYPHLDFAVFQSRTDSGSQIRDVIFYNNRSLPILRDLFDEYGSRQLVMELKNVYRINREHLNQLNRYMSDSLGKFGVLVTRNEMGSSMTRNVIDLWSGQRRCIVTLNDNDIEQMVDVYESKQRSPVEVLGKKYLEFRRVCPS
jgi:hypothetical protein